MRWILTGEELGAAEALRIGLVQEGGRSFLERREARLTGR